MLKFYNAKGSGPCMKVHAFLEESGQKYELVEVDLFKGQHRQPPLNSINVTHKLPCIELDGFPLGESNAILRYLAQRWQLHDWYPANLEQRAEVDQWSDFVTQHIGDYIGILAWHRYFMPNIVKKPADPARIAFAESSLVKQLPTLEDRLVGRKYLVGRQPSLADLALLPHMGIIGRAEINLRDFPNIAAWNRHMLQRPAWLQVSKYHGLT